MKTIILFLIFSSSLSLFSQNLTLEETIKYLDNSFKEYNFTISEASDSEGDRLRYFQVDGTYIHLNTLTEEFKFNINDISISKTTSTITKYINIQGYSNSFKEESYDIIVRCSNSDCINKGNSLFGGSLTSNFYIKSSKEILINRLFNAFQNLKYLISSENSENSNDIFDNYSIEKSLAPKLTIEQIKLIEQNNNKRIDQNETTSISFTIKNQGANSIVNAVIELVDLNNLNGLSFKPESALGNISAGQSENVTLSIYSNSNLEIGEANFEIRIVMNNNLIVKKNVKIATFNSGQESYTISEAIDIDLNIPTTNIVKPNTYALIIGNEDYKTKQPNLSEEANVKYASNDAKIFKEYINKTFGVPNTNIVFLLNATSVEMKQAINKLKQLSSINPNAEFIFYYAGHGLPVGNEKEQFLIPVDVNGSNATFGIKVNDIINELTVNNPKRVLLLFDACFSGAARNESLLSNRGVKVKPKANILKGQTIVISSSSFDEPSKSYVEKQHGMFTYFLLKKIKETKGNINLSDLFDYIQFNVKEKSILINNQLQTPTISTSSDYVKPLNNTFF